MSNIIDRLYSQEVEDRLYSTGNDMLDELLTKAYCDGYEEGQREFGKLDKLQIARQKGIDVSQVNSAMIKAFRDNNARKQYQQDTLNNLNKESLNDYRKNVMRDPSTRVAEAKIYKGRLEQNKDTADASAFLDHDVRKVHKGHNVVREMVSSPYGGKRPNVQKFRDPNQVLEHEEAKKIISNHTGSGYAPGDLKATTPMRSQNMRDLLHVPEKLANIGKEKPSFMKSKSIGKDPKDRANIYRDRLAVLKKKW